MVRGGFSRHFALIFGVAFCASLYSCTNGTSLPQNQGTDTELPPGDGAPGSEEYKIPVTSMVRSNLDSSDASQAPSLVDFVGDGSNEILRSCPSITPAACECMVRFKVTTGTSSVENEFTLNPTYIENNLIRCPLYNQSHPIPSGTNQISVFLRTIDQKKRSKSFTIGFDGTTAFTSTNENLFAPVRRYQCRKRAHVPNMFCNVVDANCTYDPFQSEHARMIRVKNFYTVNPGETLLNMAKLSKADMPTDSTSGYNAWECAFDLNFAPTIWSDPTVYTARPQPGANPGVPVVNSRTNLEFYAARKKVGIFNIPISGPYAPDVISPTASGIIGYAALSEVRNGKASCPATNDLIPKGFKWVNLYAFRSNLPSQRVVGQYLPFQSGLGNSMLSCTNGNDRVCPSGPAAGTDQNSGLFYRILGAQINFYTQPRSATTPNTNDINQFSTGLCALYTSPQLALLKKSNSSIEDIWLNPNQQGQQLIANFPYYKQNSTSITPLTIPRPVPSPSPYVNYTSNLAIEATALPIIEDEANRNYSPMTFFNDANNVDYLFYVTDPGQPPPSGFSLWTYRYKGSSPSRMNNYSVQPGQIGSPNLPTQFPLCVLQKVNS